MTGPVRYGIVEAKPRFVSELLTDLSRALALPAPVREAFLFDASREFYAACTDSIVTLQRATRKVIEHLGLACGTVIVSFASIDAAARIERAGTDWFVEIKSTHRTDARSLGAILAHECCHILVADRGVRLIGNALDEVNVDLAAILAGLGPLTLNGIRDDETAAHGVERYEHQSFGYLRAPLLEHAYADVCGRLGVATREATRRISRPTVRTSVRFKLLAGRFQRKRPALGYAPADSHAVVPCPSLTCTARLRVPCGKPGTARCPTCKAARELGGLALATAATATRVPFAARAIPTVKAMSAHSLRWRHRPIARRGLFVALILFVGAIGYAMFAGNSTNRTAGFSLSAHPVGSMCMLSSQCDSGICLETQTALGFGSSIAPITIGSYCTEACSSDADCPAPMRCADARDRDSGEAVRACTR